MPRATSATNHQVWRKRGRSLNDQVASVSDHRPSSWLTGRGRCNRRWEARVERRAAGSRRSVVVEAFETVAEARLEQ